MFRCVYNLIVVLVMLAMLSHTKVVMRQLGGCPILACCCRPTTLDWTTMSSRRQQPTLTLPALLSDLQQLSRDRSLLPSVHDSLSNNGQSLSSSSNAGASHTLFSPMSPPLLVGQTDYTSPHTALYGRQRDGGQVDADDDDGGRAEASRMAVKVASEFLDASNLVVDRVEDGVVERLREKIEASERRCRDVLTGLTEKDDEHEG